MVRISNMKLIEILMENSREKFTSIAKKFKVSETAVRKRIKKLESEGIIKRYTIEVDLKKIGFKIITIIGVDTKPESYIKILDNLKKFKEVKSLCSSSGDHMLLMKCWFRNSEELTNFVKKIENIKGVTRVCPAIILEKIK